MELTFRPMATAEDAAAFRSLNEEWIRLHFTLEDEDRRQLEDPFTSIVAPGGEVLLAELDGEVVGCVALRPEGDGVYELSKMTVAPAHRGAGLGRQILLAAIERARERGAATLFLGSSTKLAPAVHLYESVGFEHVAPESIHMPYARADVFMTMALAQPAASR
ncbi:putative N-acetyltransferase YhbS [Motilibacter rhizosphaerae]|uniref:Putative N-acetyltransferase YhbS n=1 Tax=Motilibacter rhizosphaerae TaxID=598652 RepID=A0A4Q7NAL8_9ACTN|nr:GNAT family N-acetyltransferase [Motilibacter rhizosphaerae]RZS79982.1 putative N-acetyltransferase YhbS [Motilibacter rhizosphaerae]